MKIHLRKGNGCLIPDSVEDSGHLSKFKFGDVLKAEVTRPRNYHFHKKLFALLNFAYDHWEQPEVETKYGVAGKSFDAFRRDLTILAGFYEQIVRVDGSVRVEAKSISFAEMDAEQFEELYEKMIGVILKHVLTRYSREDIDGVVEQLLMFAA